MGKTPKCALFPRHQWGWVRNIWNVRVGPRSGSATKRGCYRCDCGAEKLDVPYVRTSDLAPPIQEPTP